MTFEERFNRAMAGFLEKQGIENVVRVEGISQRSEEWRYSDVTYGGTNYYVDIEYVYNDPNETSWEYYGTFTYTGEFGDMIRQLTDED